MPRSITIRRALRVGPLLASALWLASSSHAANTETGSVAGRIEVKKAKGDFSGIVITIDGDFGRPDRMKAQVRQRNKTFVPDLTVVTRNSTVEFPNDDKIFHNVFSVSRAARFDLGLYKSGQSKSVKLRRPGEITVYCNIHPEMVTKIKVVDTPHYATTGKDGRFRIAGVPPGTYPITAWQPYGKEFKGTVTIKPGKTATVNVSMARGKKPKSHLRKDGTPYGRYK
jgi:plastocyanin